MGIKLKEEFIEIAKRNLQTIRKTIITGKTNKNILKTEIYNYLYGKGFTCYEEVYEYMKFVGLLGDDGKYVFKEIINELVDEDLIWKLFENRRNKRIWLYRPIGNETKLEVLDMFRVKYFYGFMYGLDYNVIELLEKKHREAEREERMIEVDEKELVELVENFDREIQRSRVEESETENSSY